MPEVEARPGNAPVPRRTPPTCWRRSAARCGRWPRRPRPSRWKARETVAALMNCGRAPTMVATLIMRARTAGSPRPPVPGSATGIRGQNGRESTSRVAASASGKRPNRPGVHGELVQGLGVVDHRADSGRGQGRLERVAPAVPDPDRELVVDVADARPLDGERDARDSREQLPVAGRGGAPQVVPRRRGGAASPAGTPPGARRGGSCSR